MEYDFSKSLIIHEKRKKRTSLPKRSFENVILILIKVGELLHFIYLFIFFFFEKLYQTLERVFHHPNSKHLELGLETFGCASLYQPAGHFSVFGNRTKHSSSFLISFKKINLQWKGVSNEYLNKSSLVSYKNEIFRNKIVSLWLVSLAAVFSVVTQRSSPQRH